MPNRMPHHRNRALASRMRHRVRHAAATTDSYFKRSEMRRDFWRIAFQAIAGGAVLAGLWFTSQDTARQLELARSGQITDRFSRAVDQLGDNDAIDVRIGGIYALERIARDSSHDRSIVAEVLSSFVVRTSSSDGIGREGPVPNSPLFPEARRTEGRFQTEPPTRYVSQDPLPDVQAAVTVLARMKHQMYPLFIDISGADLTGADLRNADFRNANLTDAFLAGADLAGANLSGADLQGAAFEDANLTGANLSHADLTGSWLGLSILTGADLSGARLRHAFIAVADLRGADLSNADLTNAQLGASKLSRADLEGANLGHLNNVWVGFDVTSRAGVAG